MGRTFLKFVGIQRKEGGESLERLGSLESEGVNFAFVKLA